MTEYKVDDSGDEWKPDSDETEKEESETVVESGDNIAVRTDHLSLVNSGVITSCGEGNVIRFICVSKN